MNKSLREYFDALEDIRIIGRRLVSKADAFRTIHLNDLADDLEGLADKLEAAAEKLMECSEAGNPERRLDNILDTMLLKSIEDDEAEARA